MSVHVNNPFSPHVPVQSSNFIGREEVLSLIFSQLRSPSRANIAVHGPLGVGKTSLLNYVSKPEIAKQHGLDPEKYLLCKLDCQSLAGDFTPDRFWRLLLRRVPQKLNGELRATVEELIDSEEINFEDIHDLLDELEWKDRVLVAILDEFEVVFRTHTEAAERTTRQFLGMLSSLGRRTPRTFALVVATEQPLTTLCQELEAWRGSPLPTIFVSQELAPFAQDEADALIERVLDEAEMTFSDEERERLYEYAGGHPARFQAAAAALFDAKRQGLNGKDLWKTVEHSLADSSAQGIQLDGNTGVVWVDGERVETELSPKEFSLLRFLHDNAGRVCLKNEIWEAVWPEYGEEGMTDYPIQKLVNRLRNKIEPDPSHPRYILTVWGRGYKLAE